MNRRSSERAAKIASVKNKEEFQHPRSVSYETCDTDYFQRVIDETKKRMAASDNHGPVRVIMANGKYL
ncbi:hypothetical protein UFOVP434_86 [uncultured Caudovirales phage]|uniref:Uncharacterized protein n=1 Tax=uncultured Caudovirales phage TaxID=2100421 RepID=A0A6J5MAJ1_9CAUD|nr:hypothetical protein UFOVP434_86 [uncultured Caudovirales phage]